MILKCLWDKGNFVLIVEDQSALFEKVVLIRTFLIALRSIYEYGLLFVDTPSDSPFTFQIDEDFVEKTLKMIVHLFP